MSQPTVFGAIREDIDKVCHESSDYLNGKEYNASDVQLWTNYISKDVVEKLKEISPSFKFTVMCLIIEKSDAGLHMGNSCFWNSRTDGNVTVKTETDTMHLIINVFALAL